MTALVLAGYVGDRRPEVPGAESQAGEVTICARSRAVPVLHLVTARDTTQASASLSDILALSWPPRSPTLLPGVAPARLMAEGAPGRWPAGLLFTRGLSISSCREKELAKVTIKKEDLELIVSRGGTPGRL